MACAPRLTPEPGLRVARMQPRRIARGFALEVLYEAEVSRHDPAQVLQRRVAESEDLPEALEFARSLVRGVADNRVGIDEAIEHYAPGWPLDQVAPIDISILRLGAYELLFGDTPEKVAINEAVELAKRYGSDSTSRFVNGALGAIARGRQKPQHQEESS
jgi:transcription antitermination protein NusB